MYEVAVECVFWAAHAVAMGPVREPTHHHNWRVRVVVSGRGLDDDGLLCDFCELKRRLDEAVGSLDVRDLNASPPFDRMNPTAEHLARHIAATIVVPPGVELLSVSVMEAPGCEATYRADGPGEATRRHSDGATKG